MKGKKFRRVIVAVMAVTMIFSVNTFVFADTGDSAGNEITITDVDQLSDAIANQQDGQVWKIQEGTYNLTADDLAKYADIVPGTSGQGNWYFPITKQITIIGEGDVTITSDVETPNGAWATQDLVSVWADGVTIDNVDFICKEQVNKAIEVMGKDFTLKNSTIKPVDMGEGKVNSGSIYFNTQNAGSATLENVGVHSWISANSATVTDGEISLINTTIDFSDNAYGGNGSYGVISSNDSVFKAEGLTVVVDDDTDIQNQAVNRVPSGATVLLSENVSVDSKLSLNKEGITLDLNNFEITASENFVYDKDASSNSHLVDVVADNVTVKNGTIKTTDQNRHALNVYNSEGVVLENLTLDHTYAHASETPAHDGGAPLMIGASNVTIGGTMDFITGENSWYAMNVDSREIGGNKTGSVADITDNTQLFFSGVQQGGIFIENTAGVPDNEVGVNFGEGVSMLAIDVIDNAGNFIPVAIRDGAAANVSNPGNVTGMVFDEETGTYEVTHQISLIIDYVTEPGGEPIARDSMELMAPAGEFTWIYEENFSLESFPEGYNVIDWGEVAKEITVDVVAGESNVYLYEVLVEKAENAGTGQQTPPAGENGAGADKNQGSPKTGDPFSLALLLGLMGAAGTGAGVALKRRSR